MRLVVQRVINSSVTIDGILKSEIGAGLLILIAIHHEDTPEKASWAASKCCELRIFNDENGKMNRSLLDVNGEALIISQFTLYGDCSRGRRPGFTESAPPEKGKELYSCFIEDMKRILGDKRIGTGEFGADMKVSLVNDGPVTLVIDR